MTATSYPGVYMEEVSGGARPIELAGTSTAAFFGMADRGPIGEVRKIFNFDEYENLYGGFRNDGQFLSHGVYQFFNNGGKDCYVGRVASNYTTAEIKIYDRATSATVRLVSLTISASSPGAWGNHIRILIGSAADKPNVFKLTVKEDNPNASGGGAVLETYEDMSMDPDAASFVEAIVNNNSQHIRVKVESNRDSATSGYSESGVITGADDSTTFLAVSQRKFQINVSGDGWRTVDITEAMNGRLSTRLEDIRGALQAAISTLNPLRNGTDPQVYSRATVTAVTTGTNQRKLRITAGLSGVNSRVEILPTVDADNTLTGALNLGSRNGGEEVYGHAPMRPMDTASGDHYLLGDDTVDTVVPLRVAAITAGSDGGVAQPADFANALHWLDKITDVSLIAVPGVGSTFLADSGMSYCRNRPLSDCFYIADMPAQYDTLAEAKQYAAGINTPNSYGAVYFPWLKVPDPSGKSPQPIIVPPSGFVAGMYAQTDARRGVWKAPAGLEAAIAGPVGMAAELTDQEQGDLNLPPKSVCVIRKFPSSGMVLWGARTLSTDPEYKYIPVRRMAILLRKSIFNGIQWAVFEGNDHRLWSSLRLNIGSFMNGLFRAGAFQGEKSSDAYFVRCGLGDTMTQGDIDRGQVIVLVGFAPLKPAEFVIVRIQQMAGQQ